MPAFRIVSPERETFVVDASNWLMALGQGVERIGGDLSRLACEQLMNGTVLARDPMSGRTWVVKPLAVTAELDVLPEPSEELLALDGDPDDTMDAPVPPELLERPPRRRAVTLNDEALASVVNIDDPSEVALRVLAIADAPTAVETWERGLLLARELVGTEAGSAIAARADGLVFVAVAGPFSAKLKGVKLPSGTGVAGFCIARGVSVALQDAGQDQRMYQAVDRELGYRTKRLLVAPVTRRAVTYGCIELLNPVGDRAFVRKDVVAVEMVADAVAERLRQLEETGLFRA